MKCVFLVLKACDCRSIVLSCSFQKVMDTHQSSLLQVRKAWKGVGSEGFTK